MVPVKIPIERGGWWHAYVCPAHGVELDHVALTGGVFPPEGAPCRYGCRVDTPDVRGAWTVLAHQACARHIRDLALAGHRAEAAELLAEYAELYASLGERHEGAAGWMLRGRLFHQALTEAIWAVSIGQAAWAVGDPAPQTRALLALLASAARAARAELAGQGRFTANYTAWLDAAGAVCSRDPRWLTDEHGVYAHVLASVGEDGWEWEGSTYYHAFVLRAYLLALRGTPDDAVPAPVLRRLRAMADALAAVTTPGGVVPALHDGPYARPEADREHAELRALLAERGWPLRTPAPVTVFGDVGYAVLRGDGIHAIVDFGPHGGSHGHRDKLALYLYGATTPWQPDPGQVPYGHAGWRAYYASTAAHPTFSVDGAEQAECAGTLLDAGESNVTVGVEHAYPGVRARRTVALTGGGLVDELTVEADPPRRITCQLRPDVPLDVRVDGATTHTTWSGEQTLHGEHTCTDPAAMPLVRPGPGPADDPQRVRTHVDWTAPQAAAVTFRSTYRPGGGP
jgi:hypothetical protein